MRTSFETERLFLREIQPSDDLGFFELDSDPEVHRYLGNNPTKTIEESREVIANIRQQYLTNGIGRWAVFLKETGEFIGWAGLKMETNVNGFERFCDLGYRLIQKHWGKGYATEASMAFIKFGFEELKIAVIYASTSAQNKGSQNVLEKCGLKYVNTFLYDGEDEFWYEIHNPNLKSGAATTL